MKIKIIADSSCDMFSLEGVEFASVPLTVATEEKSFLDNESLNIPEMLRYMENYEGRSFTACPNVAAWLQAYQGADELYVITLSSNISGTYGAAVSAAALYKEECPHAKIQVFDTLSAGPEVRMLAQKIATEVKKGKPFDEICQEAEQYTKNTRIFFCLQSFHNFAQNGRVNKTIAKLGGMLGIRIMATASDKGTIAITDKCRGEKGAQKKFLENLEKAGYQGGYICLAHCENIPFATSLADAISQQFPGANIQIYETRGLCSYYAERGGVLLGFET